MIDLHCHILPGIDDGARNLEEAVEMCRMAVADGCRAMVATPHQRRGAWWNSDREAILGLARELQSAVGPELRVLVGGEVHVDSGLLSEVEKLPGGGIFTLAGSRYLLIEFETQGRPGEAIHLVHELVVAGWRPIVAHPEFIPWLAGDPDLLKRLVSLGALTQITAMSVTGDFGRGPMTETHALID
jgi:protein-tyrosine phosphatase